MNYTDIAPRTVDAGWVLCDCGMVQPMDWDRAYCARCFFTLPDMCHMWEPLKPSFGDVA